MTKTLAKPPIHFNPATINSNSSTTPNFDNLLLQSLMSRLQLRSPNPPPFSAGKSLEELLFSDLLPSLSESDSDPDEENVDSSDSSRSQLAKEESKLEKEIVRIILSGEIEKLKPNSGQAVAFGEHHICIGFHEGTGSDYRVWEWHGHIMVFDEESGYTPEYIYGNYFERVIAGKREIKKTMTQKNDDDREKERVDFGEDKVANGGLKELIECGDEPASGRILHRNINASCGPTRFT